MGNGRPLSEFGVATENNDGPEILERHVRSGWGDADLDYGHFWSANRELENFLKKKRSLWTWVLALLSLSLSVAGSQSSSRTWTSWDCRDSAISHGHEGWRLWIGVVVALFQKGTRRCAPTEGG